MNDFFDVAVDFSQNRRIQVLEEEISSERRLRSKLSKTQGDLGAKLDRATATLDAFIELYDLQKESVLFDRHAKIRAFARRSLVAMSEPGADPRESGPPPPDDVHGYWLGPATLALFGLLGPELDTAEDPLTEAMSRDAHRSTLFLVLALSALGRTESIRTEWVQSTFGTVATDRPVSLLQRRIWLESAHGELGEAGNVVVQGELTSAASGLDRSEWPTDLNVPTHKPSEDPAERSRLAEKRLTALGAGCRQALGEAAESTTPDESKEIPTAAALLASLIYEGAPEERELLARERELRHIVAGDSSGPLVPESFDRPTRSMAEFLRDDFQRKGDPSIRRTAYLVLGPVIKTAAKALADAATEAPPVRHVLRMAGKEVSVTADGVDEQSLSEAESAISSKGHLGLGWRRGVGYALGLTGLALLLTGPVLPMGAVGLCGFLLLGIGGVLVWQAFSAQREQARETTRDLERLRDKATTAAAKLAEHRDGAPARAARVHQELQAITMLYDSVPASPRAPVMTR